jgi:hypothetical protein
VRVQHLLLQTSVCESRLQITPWLGGVGRLSRTARHDVHHPALGVEGRHDGDFPAADVGTVGGGDGVLGAGCRVTAITNGRNDKNLHKILKICKSHVLIRRGVSEE